MTRHFRFAALTVTAVALMLAGCSSAPDSSADQTPPPAPETPAPESDPAAVETPEPADNESADPTCETIISPSTVTTFTDLGWTFKEQEFRFGATVIKGGIECVWGDYTVASDHVQIFGWAPLDADASTAAQQELINSGWLRADADGHTYITEDPAYAMSTDEEGFGMTYEFGDGWVTLADAKQSLILIDWP
ncbi:MAG: hypothetical protein ACTH8F_03850 [Microbacterium sp.]|uniref:hypothetical protein n=1 Tax=Microbacterium sp. TaxID=51671 RepID=UPI003F947781